jgi:hypothetical protein
MRNHKIEATAQALVDAGVIPQDRLDGAISTIQSYWSNSMAVVWDIEDVRLLDASLSDQQCREVLAVAARTHDANIGINWEVLDVILKTFEENKNENPLNP